MKAIRGRRPTTLPRKPAQPLAPWPASSVEMRPIDMIRPDPRNANIHPPEQLAHIAESMRQFGWTIPLLVDESDNLIAGHGRILTARMLINEGRSEFSIAPTMVARGWTEPQKRAYAVMDNQLARLSYWNEELLRGAIGDLRALDFDTTALGFDDDFLRNLFADRNDGQEDPDAVPDIPADPISREGDVWILGNHRLLCGDSTKAADVKRALAGALPHLMVTDPPYGVEYDADWRNKAARHSEGMGNRAIGAGAVGKVLNDDRSDWREAWALFPGDVAYVWHAGRYAGTAQASLGAVGFEVRSQIIWAKQQFAIGRGDYHWQHEPCYYAVRSGKKGHWNGDRKQTTLWSINKPQKSETGHSTQKPVECMRRPIENNSKPGDSVYEPFCGSGSTIIAGEMTGRYVIAIELNPAYVDVAVERWQTFSGKTAVLEASGKSFEATAAERKKSRRRAKA
jgi:DNA modification methylase